MPVVKTKPTPTLIDQIHQVEDQIGKLDQTAEAMKTRCADLQAELEKEGEGMTSSINVQLRGGDVDRSIESIVSLSEKNAMGKARLAAVEEALDRINEAREQMIKELEDLCEANRTAFEEGKFAESNQLLAAAIDSLKTTFLPAMRARESAGFGGYTPERLKAYLEMVVFDHPAEIKEMFEADIKDNGRPERAYQSPVSGVTVP